MWTPLCRYSGDSEEKVDRERRKKSYDEINKKRQPHLSLPACTGMWRNEKTRGSLRCRAIASRCSRMKGCRVPNTLRQRIPVLSSAVHVARACGSVVTLNILDENQYTAVRPQTHSLGWSCRCAAWLSRPPAAPPLAAPAAPAGCCRCRGPRRPCLPSSARSPAPAPITAFALTCLVLRNPLRPIRS